MDSGCPTPPLIGDQLLAREGGLEGEAGGQEGIFSGSCPKEGSSLTIVMATSKNLTSRFVQGEKSSAFLDEWLSESRGH